MGDTFLLLLLRPSCLSFARTNKIKLNCLKIAKNEAKCQRGPQSGAAEQPKNQNGYEPVALSGRQGAVGVGGKGVTAQVACFFL